MERALTKVGHETPWRVGQHAVPSVNCAVLHDGSGGRGRMPMIIVILASIHERAHLTRHEDRYDKVICIN